MRRASPQIMLVISPTASRTSSFISLHASPNMFDTTCKIAASEKLTASEPFLSPVRPTMPVTSPSDHGVLPLKNGLPTCVSVKAMVCSTLTAASRKGLMKVTSIKHSFGSDDSDGFRLLQARLQVKGLTP